ncbi:aspartate--tRNA ligase msd1, partial [Spiromyces aspiralis]
YGSDKPDTRFGLEIVQLDVNELLGQVAGHRGDDITSDEGWRGNIVEALVVPDGAKYVSRKDLDSLGQLCQNSQRNYESIVTTLHKYLAESDGERLTGISSASLLGRITSSIHVEDGEARLIAGLKEVAGIRPNDLVVISERSKVLSDSVALGFTTMGRVRLHLHQLLSTKGYKFPELLPEGSHSRENDHYSFLWVVDFPLFTRQVECAADGSMTVSTNWSSTHHPFTAPMVAPDSDVWECLLGDPGKIRGQHYDLVLNGLELGGGSIRIHDPAVQTMVFEKILKLEPAVRNRFQHLLTALGQGCPPHGGIALGLDRLISVLCGSASLRDVIAFPKAADGLDLFNHSPAPVTTQELAQYGLREID